MIPVSRVIPEALSAILRQAPLTPEKVAFAWRTAVGPGVASATTIDLQDSVLRVTTRDAVWQQEVERSAALIRARLDALLGSGVVRYVEVSGPTPPLSEGGSSSVPRRP